MTESDDTRLQSGLDPLSPLRNALLGSTVIPELGLTFAEAGEKWHRLKAEEDHAFATDDERFPWQPGGCPWDDLAVEREQITKALMSTAPQTLQDVRIILDVLSTVVPKGVESMGGELCPEIAPVLDAVNSTLSAAPALLSSACELSPAIVSAYWSVRRMADVYAFMQEWQRDLREGTREESAFTGFAEAASDLRDHLLTACYSTPATSIADHLLKVRVSLDIERSNALGALDSAAREGLEAIVRSVPFPAAPVLNDLPVPTADEEARAFLTAHPEQIPNASPADLLRLFTPDEGAEVFAILAGYVAAKRGAPDKLPKAIASLRAYGEHLAEGFNPYAEVYRCAPGIALSEDERASLGRLGYLSAAAIKRLDRWTRRTKAKREEQNKIAEAVEKARRELQERERHGPPLSELLQQALPDFTPEACAAAASTIVAAEFLTCCRVGLMENVSKLQRPELEALRSLDIATLPKHLRAGTQETLRQELAILLHQAGQQPDTFADTVAEFASEGTSALALPGAPTDAMVIAGAKAAGCTPEDLRRGYDAMVAAYAQERAA